MTAALVVLGAIVGAPLRFLVDRVVQDRHRLSFPLGTVAVNLIACVGLGFLTGAASAGAASADLQTLLGTGLCATLSTYSTFSFETLRLVEQGRLRSAGANIVISVIACLAAAAAGDAVAQAIWA